MPSPTTFFATLGAALAVAILLLPQLYRHVATTHPRVVGGYGSSRGGSDDDDGRMAPSPSAPTLRNRRIALVIAHPDDEAMFFAPAVLALTRPAANNHVRILCLSTGDAYGLGATRRAELKASARLLGLRSDDDVHIIDSPDFPDSGTAHWDTTKISDLLASFFAPHLPPSSSAATTTTTTTAPSSPPEIDTLLTFDSLGVSHHVNHKSVHKGARAFAARLRRLYAATAAASRPSPRGPVDLYELTTVSLLRKYSGYLDVLASAAASSSSSRSDDGDGADGDGDDGTPRHLVFASSLDASSSSSSSSSSEGSSGATYAAARRAMVEAHRSQMAWFRWGWITLSRYMYVNDLRLVEQLGAEAESP